MEHLRRMGRQTETVNVVYVTDRLWQPGRGRIPPPTGPGSAYRLDFIDNDDSAVSLSAFADRRKRSDDE